ncbi:MAG: LysE family transporter [Candidatus Hodarchaeales archaeon]
MTIIEFLGIWVVTAALGVTLAAPLGPINLELIKNALDTSLTRKAAWFSAFLIGIGAMTGDFIVALSALTVGGEVLESFFSNLWIKFLLFGLNLIILGYLGISTLLKSPIDSSNSFNPSLENYKTMNNFKSTSLLRKYFTGLSIVVTSPWSYLWWTSVGTIILFSDFSLPDLFSRIIIVVMFLSGIFLWMIAFSTILTIIGKSPNPKFFSRITKGTALILLFFALIILRDMLITLAEIVN